MITVSLAEAGYRLNQLLEALTGGNTSETARLTEDGKPVLALLPWDLYETLVELAEIAQDPRALLAAPPHVRERILAATAARAETIYRSNPELTDFDAFGDGDISLTSATSCRGSSMCRDGSEWSQQGLWC
jgi:hypothetical protein